MAQRTHISQSGRQQVWLPPKLEAFLGRFANFARNTDFTVINAYNGDRFLDRPLFQGVGLAARDTSRTLRGGRAPAQHVSAEFAR